MSSQPQSCFSCRTAFANTDFLKLHYKTKWHQYNLNRKVANLPALTAEQFHTRVILPEEQKKVQDIRKISYCEVCRKKFNNQNSYVTHMNSKKHLSILNNKSQEEQNVASESEEQNIASELEKQNIAAIKKNCPDSDTDSEIEEVDSDEWTEDAENPIAFHDCLFCSNHSRNLVKNIKHMGVAHSFLIPDLEYVVNLKGLLMYLGEKVSIGFTCIWCQKAFHSFESVQQHMVDKGHTKILFEGETLAEFTDFYDYTSSYPDDGKVSMDEVSILDYSNHQLVLPSGTVIGHRSLLKYFKQNLNPTRTIQGYGRQQMKLNRIFSTYRAIGFKTCEQESLKKRARDLNFMRRFQQRNRMHLGVKSNKLIKVEFRL